MKTQLVYNFGFEDFEEEGLNHQIFGIVFLEEDALDHMTQTAEYIADNHFQDDDGAPRVIDMEMLSKEEREVWSSMYSQGNRYAALTCAYKTDCVIWLIKNDVPFEIQGVYDDSEDEPEPMFEIIISDQSQALLFKLTWGGDS